MQITILTIYEKGKPEWGQIVGYLKRKKLHVYQVSSLNEVYTTLKSEPINIILCDYDILKIKTATFLAKIKHLTPYVELIFLSEHPTLSNAIDAMKNGAYDFYELPVKTRLLMTVMEKALEKQVLFLEKMELENKIKGMFQFGNMQGRSKPMQYVFNIVNSVASKNTNILITGETGTGKEMVAKAIHYNSTRASKPFIKVNCGAFNEGVLESEIFGHEKGAFTGAIIKRVGRFELANEGTIFLDEIGDISLSTQVKLLRVLQEKEFERVGGNETIKVDIRVLAATNQDLIKIIAEKKFRKDLYYRLNIVHIEVPPLRERKDDIPLLVSYFINNFNEEKGYGIKGINKNAMQMLLNYTWPGNVRELENAVEAAMALAPGEVIEAKYLPSFLLLTKSQHADFYQIPQNFTLEEAENEIIRFTLEKTNGNKSKTAKLLGIGLRTLQRKIKNLPIHFAEGIVSQGFKN
ncbi:MAG: sigma-54-dependent Fis family transcriptional regulator [Candidatus Scalindua sp. AMX11]|nr:MAG: sigma-54-dependent Fis family transcriptional regulator [Candidatus Scalindua sp.]NOG84743.1 sigma-54-dependent Fis family transcriptional regulator [Planctomycetota bacterium]RZV98348.1 MAG: sigma-54-dependent Fis family transcriptional regulator [Candidatus Scalindua sp. SCAELEC01]TDE66559.1 MAG: sigma-54-dependent Fis family transcriptional regulator [Candidatus Scalindua sp. AMX11]GJQ58928.1 MAG: acetoacetate metabolism regulatory protein AtoC [Candidatus Scalindua sp.]